MNLRISEEGFRFRVTSEDLSTLLHGREIDQSVCLGAHCFAYRITPVTFEKDMKLEMAIAGFCLYVPQTMLEELRDLGRSKKGLSVMQGDVNIALQLDIKTQMRKSA